jgi:hypothetical protein
MSDDEERQFEHALLGTLVLCFRSGLKTTLKQMAKNHGNKSGQWLDEIEADVVDGLKATITEGINVTIEAQALNGALNIIGRFFGEVRGELTGSGN